MSFKYSKGMFSSERDSNGKTQIKTPFDSHIESNGCTSTTEILLYIYAKQAVSHKSQTAGQAAESYRTQLAFFY